MRHRREDEPRRLARAIDPVHTPVDGDCVFVLATGSKDGNVFQVGVGRGRGGGAEHPPRGASGQRLGGVPSVAELGAWPVVMLRRADHPE